MIAKIIALLLSIAGQVTDVVTTWIVLGMGGIETNPVLGPDPNLILVFIVKMTFLAFAFYLLKGMARMRVLAFGGLVGFGAAGWNFYVFQAATQTLPQI